MQNLYTMKLRLLSFICLTTLILCISDIPVCAQHTGNQCVANRAAWMERIAVNTALERLRRERRLGEVRLDAERGLPPVEEPSAEETARIPEEVLMRFVNELPDGYRTVFNLYCIEEYSHREIAEMLGINEKSSSSQLFRARMMLSRKIRAWLDKQGL